MLKKYKYEGMFSKIKAREKEKMETTNLLDKIERLLPKDIEKRSFEIIKDELNKEGILLDK